MTGERQVSRREWVRRLLGERGGPCRVKLCGLSRIADVAAASEAAPDLCGFVVDVARSRRSVSPETLRRLVLALDPAIVSVGVFVDEPISHVASLVSDGVIDVAQLHGTEDDAYLVALRDACSAPLIQAFVVRSTADVERANASLADLVLLDGGRGEGRTFDWSLLADMRRPFLLAGGLTADNVTEAAAAAGPLLWGVDLSSGIESDGTKDASKMRAAVDVVRQVERRP